MSNPPPPFDGSLPFSLPPSFPAISAQGLGSGDEAGNRPRTPHVNFPDLRDARRPVESAPIATATRKATGTPEVVFVPAPGAVETVENLEPSNRRVASPSARAIDPTAASSVTETPRRQSTNIPSTPSVDELPDSDWNDETGESRDRPRSRVPTSSELPFFPTSDRISPHATASIADQILRRHPAATHGVIGFAGCGHSSDVEDTCVMVARELAERAPGRILLIDADSERAPLSRLIQNPRAPGWKNLLAGATRSIDDLLLRSRELPLDFLPAGSVTIESWLNASQVARRQLHELETRYRFVCLSLGSVFAASTPSLATYCHGVFLQVHLGDTSRRVAQLAARELQRAGAPLLGCLASDVAPTS